ncbi:hypothetical protein TVAG_022210 [Trichomonas vaginalis G3]|uniref:Uncharacterized protein n=1 Tax=Trichomonas vaginalis (strain ATCC PRA-98 / G3) TaxID=412133 RepID=A2FFT9_TRIV3|nr:armadillo (ARM) repeat-containing protein family [Trichomonas vaginalis G3]EAX96238.1 hypothetical protein TVAG_022210 [Trichomonas vaginalis G3]KAI5520991.1 armadillo (ARM) repeat-containing protein family [Trichomonas vaginalis G3]|eukprot:XP_001309168.1 hypothetical protein [Trichomonas vaginalis G3]
MDSEYKDSLLEKHSSLLITENPECEEYMALSDEELIQNFVYAIDNCCPDLISRISQLKCAVQKGRILNCPLFDELSILQILKDIILTWMTIPIKDIASEIVCMCFFYLPLTKLTIFLNSCFFHELYVACNHNHLYAFKLYGKIATYVKEAREYLFETCGVQAILESYRPDQKHYSESVMWLICCCCTIDTPSYPIILDFLMENLESTDTLTPKILFSITYAIYYICKNGHGPEIYNHPRFSQDFISHIFSILNPDATVNFLQALNYITVQTEGAFQLPTLHLINLLRSEEKQVSNAAVFFITNAIRLNKNTSATLIDESFLEAISDILNEDPIFVRVGALKILEEIAVDVDPTKIILLLPQLFQFVPDGTLESTKLALNIIYTSLSACSDQNLLEEVKNKIIEDDGVESLNECLDIPEVESMAEMILKFFEE